MFAKEIIVPKDKTLSHVRVKEAAKEEFLKEGYMKASMRKIGARAGMSQAGLYRHYPSKELMFDALVAPAMQDLEVWHKRHRDSAYASLENDADVNELFADTNIDLMRDVVFKHKDEFRLILNCSQGTKYENFIHDFVRIEQKEMMVAFKKLADSGVYVKEISEDELHMLISAYDTALFEPIVHDWPIEKALHGLEVAEEFFKPGWMKLMGY